MPSATELLQMVPVSFTAPSLNNPAVMHSLAQVAAAREHAYGQEAAAAAQALGKREATSLSAAAHEKAAREAANVHEAGALQRAAMQQRTGLTQADIARRSAEATHEGTQEFNLARVAAWREQTAKDAAKAAKDAYEGQAHKIFGIESMKKATPAQTQLYQEHMGNLPALKSAWEGHQWWSTHGSPEHISGFLDYARSQGATITPERESLFRAQAGSRSPEIRQQFGSSIEEYVRNKAKEPTFYQ